MSEEHNVNDYFKEEKEKKLKEYLEQQEELSKKQAEKRKRKDLVARGLYRLVKSKDYEVGAVFNQEENCYITKIPYDLTDEEYELVKQYNTVVDDEEGSSFIYGATLAAGWLVLIIGIVVSLVIGGNEGKGYEALTGLLSTFISSVTFFALARIIYLLEKRKN